MFWPQLIIALRLKWGSRGCQGSEAAGELQNWNIIQHLKKKKRLKELFKNGENLLLETGWAFLPRKRKELHRFVGAMNNRN